MTNELYRPGTALGQLHQDVDRINRKNNNEMAEITSRLARLERSMRAVRSSVNGLLGAQKATADRLTTLEERPSD